METLPDKFIGEPILVEFDSEPIRAKTPPCPNVFIWHEQRYKIEQVLEEWSDFSRRGRMARNMQPAHLSAAARAGSWGVGRFYFRVKVNTGEIFEIYYDRAPEDVDNRKGGWFLLGERKIIQK